MIKKYKHTQIGYLQLIAYSTVILFMMYLTIVTDFEPYPLVGLIVMLIVLGSFATLTVKVSGGMIKVQFGVGAIRKRILLKDVQAYCTVKNHWYYGW